MKKYLLLAALVPFAVYGQKSSYSERPSIGINLGPTFSNIRGNDVAEQNDYAFNFLAGVSFEHPLSNKLAVLAAVNYERKTFKQDVYIETGDFDPIFDPAFNSGEVTIKGTFHYITIPLDIRYYIGEKKRFFINAGPYAGFFIDDTYTVDGDKAEDGDKTTEFKTMDFGINLGIGTRFTIEQKQRIGVEIRHNYGFSNISDMEDLSDDKVKTNAFNLIVNWSFEL